MYQVLHYDHSLILESFPPFSLLFPFHPSSSSHPTRPISVVLALPPIRPSLAPITGSPLLPPQANQKARIGTGRDSHIRPSRSISTSTTAIYHPSSSPARFISPSYLPSRSVPTTSHTAVLPPPSSSRGLRRLLSSARRGAYIVRHRQSGACELSRPIADMTAFSG